MSKLIICSVGALMLSCAAAHAQTATPQDRPIVIKYADLDLGSPAGRAVLKARVDAGVAAFCGPEPVIGDLAAFSAYKACVKDATAKTMPKAQEIMAMRQAPILSLSEADRTH